MWQNWTFDKPTKEKDECLYCHRLNTNLNTRQMDAATVPSLLLCFSAWTPGTYHCRHGVKKCARRIQHWKKALLPSFEQLAWPTRTVRPCLFERKWLPLQLNGAISGDTMMGVRGRCAYVKDRTQGKWGQRECVCVWLELLIISGLKKLNVFFFSFKCNLII